jgi:hypothetical protein
MTKASKPTPKQNHPDQLDLIDYIKEKEAQEAFLACHHHEITHIIAAHKFVSVRTNTTKGE